MVLNFNKKTRDDLVAIKNFINDYKGEIDEMEFYDFIISYEYYVTYYKNYHIFRDLIKYHNSHYKDPVKEKVIFPDSPDSDLDLLFNAY